MIYFIKDEHGAATVDSVVLAAGVFGIATIMYTSVQSGVASVGGGAQSQFDQRDIQVVRETAPVSQPDPDPLHPTEDPSSEFYGWTTEEYDRVMEQVNDPDSAFYGWDPEDVADYKNDIAQALQAAQSGS